MPRCLAHPCLRRRSTPWLALPALLLSLVGAAAAQGGSVTDESIWDRNNAIQRAQAQLPPGATVTRSSCTVVNVRDGNDRYICTLYYTVTPAAPSPGAASAPAP